MNSKKHWLCCIFLTVIILLSCATASAQEYEHNTISISSADDLYALGRIFAPETAKSKYLAGYNLDDDFSRFDIPEELTLKKEKIEYLLQCHYILTTDIALSYCQTAEGGYFMGLGCSEYPFCGSFNGNGHTISLSAIGDIGVNYYTGANLGIFNVTKNATIENLNISVEDSVILKSSYTNIYFGGIAGNATTTEFTDCKLSVKNAQFGIMPADSNSKRSYVWLGGLIGYCNGSTLQSCSVELLNSSIVFHEQEDGLNTQTGIGGFIGRTVYDTAETTITDCRLYAVHSNIQNHTASNGATGACIGNAKKTTITSFIAELENSSIQTTAANAQTGSMYSVLSTGGLIGFSQPGSSNTSLIGNPGNIISNCVLRSENAESMDIILSCAETGSELTAGGLVGCSFNNLIVKNSSVYVKNGRIVAEKKGSSDLDSTYGTQVGGIIGRLEHTGELNGCTVIGDKLLIHSKAPNNQSNAGGIVGIDLGPYHKDIISINKCTFDGSGNSEICMEVTSSDAVGSKPVSVGAIAGTSTYIVADCVAKDVTVALITPALSNPTYCSATIGNYIKSWGWWAYKDYFTPRTPEIINCTSHGIIWSGGCGEAVRWYIGEDVLRISGQGSMTDFSSAQATPWYKTKDRLAVLEIDAGLKHIGQYAFSECGFLTVVIPESVQSIGDYAFYDCRNLKNIALGSGLLKIGKAVLSGSQADHIAYGGTQKDYAAIEIDADNPLLSESNISHWNISKFPEITNPGVKPTCTSIGLSEGKNCALCGKVLAAQSILPITAHIFDDCICTGCGKTTEANVSIYQNGKRVKSYTTTEAALLDYSQGQYLVLHQDITVTLTLNADIYIDLNGFDLTGTITPCNYDVLCMDSTTDNYTMEAIGYFNCLDDQGNALVPVNHLKSDITGSVKRYMSVKDENGYSFHRFFLGITHTSLKPTTSGVGYKATFCGDDMVKASLNETEAFGYALQLGTYSPKFAYKPREAFVSGNTITMRVDSFDVETYGETPLSAKVLLKLSDGTVIESEPVSMTMRSILEAINANHTAFTAQQLTAVQAMIAKHTIMKQWDTANLYA